MKIGFIGAGNMAGAIIRGMVGGGFRGSDILIYDTDSAKMVALFEECGVSICSSGAEVAGLADAVVLAVKPQVFPAVLPELSPVLHRRRPLVISIAARQNPGSHRIPAGRGSGGGAGNAQHLPQDGRGHVRLLRQFADGGGGKKHRTADLRGGRRGHGAG